MGSYNRVQCTLPLFPSFPPFSNNLQLSCSPPPWKSYPLLFLSVSLPIFFSSLTTCPTSSPYPSLLMFPHISLSPPLPSPPWPLQLQVDWLEQGGEFKKDNWSSNYRGVWVGEEVDSHASLCSCRLSFPLKTYSQLLIVLSVEKSSSGPGKGG